MERAPKIICRVANVGAAKACEYVRRLPKQPMPEADFRRYLNGFGRKRLRQIKNKYFSDTAVQLWNLCYAFFDKTYALRLNPSQPEYLIAKSFDRVFEAIVDALIGDSDIPAGLKAQADGKRIDHFYTYPGLFGDYGINSRMYYIGDSKYYKIGSHPGAESVYKQYTYARNVVQWNVNLFLDAPADESDEDRQARLADKGRFGTVRLRDDTTDGYDVIPNFFISADIDPDNLNITDKVEAHAKQPAGSRQYNNRLYDRDTLIVAHFDLNFLALLSLYARNSYTAKAAWQRRVREAIRLKVGLMLTDRYAFYVLKPREGVDAAEALKTNYKLLLGKIRSLSMHGGFYSLALSRENRFEKENSDILAVVEQYFHTAPCSPGDNPMDAFRKPEEP